MEKIRKKHPKINTLRSYHKRGEAKITAGMYNGSPCLIVSLKTIADCKNVKSEYYQLRKHCLAYEEKDSKTLFYLSSEIFSKYFTCFVVNEDEGGLTVA